MTESFFEAQPERKEHSSLSAEPQTAFQRAAQIARQGGPRSQPEGGVFPGTPDVDKHLGAAKVDEANGHIQFVRAEQLCQISNNCDRSAPQSPAELADGIDKAVETNNFHESDKQIEKAIQGAFAGGGLQAVRELEKQINSADKTHGVMFDYPHEAGFFLAEKRDFNTFYLNKLSADDLDGLAKIRIFPQQLLKDSQSRPVIVLGSGHQMQLYKGPPPGVHEYIRGTK
ncbi:MAG TPA: hypothetical protein V6D22_05050 [Candidatus Obscuribacterales bacterium]